jgi:predicted nucleotidyltransferase
MESADIKKLLAEAGPPLFERYGVDLAYLFGSANSGRFRPLSDIDIAVRFKPDHTPDDFFRLSALLEVKLARLLRRKTDINILNLASPLLCYEVVKNGAVLFSVNDEEHILFHIRTYRDCDDFCRAQQFYIHSLRERLQLDYLDKKAQSPPQQPT